MLETAVAVGLITTFTQFSQQYYQPIRLQPAGAVCSWPLQGLDQEMFDALEEVRPENAPAFTEPGRPVEIGLLWILLCGRQAYP